ncbi:MAG TPA: restriction endonuclease [Anaerolineae bacterium]|nr:restriction endonuclease [Anaerolineae bacterium]
MTERDWTKYEKQIYDICRVRYARCQVTYDDRSIKGVSSETKRQIDVSIKTQIEGVEILGIIECKKRNEDKITIDDIDKFVSFLKDVRANFGYIVTTSGFSRKARVYAQNQKNIFLQIVGLGEFQQESITTDDITNHVISSLECDESVFLIRVRNWTGFVDLKRTSFLERTIYFRNFDEKKYVRTEKVLVKKLLEQTARGFRDFPCLEKLKVVIPLAFSQYEYQLEIFKHEYEHLLGVDFQELNRDIKLWRGFLGRLGLMDKKPFEKYITKYVI